MAITIRSFSQVRERLGTDRLTIEASGLHTVGDVVRFVAGTQPGGAALTEWLASGHLRLARNRVHVRADEPVTDGDEVALFPPVSGG